MFTAFADNKCFSLEAYGYLHIASVTMAATQSVTLALEEHNPVCNSAVSPYPETWGGVDLRRYLQPSGDAWVPLAHFRINLQRVAALSLKSFFDTTAITMGKMEFTTTLGGGAVPEIMAQSPMHFRCVDPTSIALCIDDGM